MKKPRYEFALVSCDESLYSSGGSDSSGKPLSSVDQISNFTGPWKTVQPMQEPRAGLAAISCDGIIYAIGGKSEDEDDVSALSSVEQYSASEDAWAYVKNMQFERYGHSACVLDGKVYVFGGWGESGLAVSEIECFDPIHNFWTTVGETNTLIGRAIVTV